MAVTRIKNNQITDSTITNVKIATGTLTGALFNPNLTIASNITITGNLSVTGNTTTVNSIDTLVNDPLVIFNSGYVGSPSYDVGIIVNRALGQIGNYGGKNAAWVWREADGAFEPILTTETGGTTGTINRSFYANIITGNLTSMFGLSATTANFGSINNTPIGNATPSTGAFTSLSTTLTGIFGGNIVANATTASTNSTTGALVVKGGTGIVGALHVDGKVEFTENTENTGPNTGAFQVVAGGAYIAGNLFVGGNINLQTANITTITGTAGQFYGNAAGFGALYAGIPSGYTFQDQTIVQNSGNFNGYAQVNLQNINGGSEASGDFVVTADNGTATGGFIDMGINNSGFAITAGNELNKPGDGYIYVHGATGGTGNLVVGTMHATDIIFTSNGFAGYNEQARFQNNVGLIIKQGTQSTLANTGALQVWGGASVSKNLFVGGAITLNGDFNGNIGTFVTLNATTGNTTNGKVTTLVATNFSSGNAWVTGGNIEGTTIGAAVASTGNFTTANATTITGYTANITTVNATSANVTTLTTPTVNAGNVTAWGVNATRGNVTTLGAGTTTTATLNTTAANITGGVATTLVVTNFSSGNVAITGGYADDVKIGANSATTGTFTFANATGIYSIDGTVVNMNSTNGNITTLTAPTINAGNVTTWGLNATSGNITALSLGNLTAWGINVTNANVGRIVATTGLSTANAVITGGYADSFKIGANTASTGRFTTLETTADATIGGNIGLTGDIIPSANVTYNLGSTNKRFKDLWLAGTTIYLGSGTLSVDNEGNVIIASRSSNSITLVDGAAAKTIFTSNIIAPYFLGNLEGTTSKVSTAIATTGNIGTVNASTTTTATLNTTAANITGGVATTLVATNFSTANAQVTGGDITGMTRIYGTTGLITNFGSGNAVITGGYADNFPIGPNTASTGNFTTANAKTVDSYTTNATTLNATTGNITTLTAPTINAGNVTTWGVNVTSGNITTLGVSAINAGNVTTWGVNASNGNVTTLVATTGFSTANARITGGYADNFPIGANTAATGAFTALTASGNVTFTSSQSSNNATSGGLVVSGGVGIGGNLNVAGNTVIQGYLIVQGTTTTISSTTLDVADLNVTLAKGATSAAAANGAGITVDGAGATITYASADDSWNFNKKVNFSGISLGTLDVVSANILTGFVGNLSSGNAILTGGNITGMSYVTATSVEGIYANTQSLIAGSAQIFGGNATNMWSVGTNNAIITGGTIDNTAIGGTTPTTAKFTTATADTVDAQTVTATSLNATNGNVTTLVATVGFSAANVVISGGTIDNTSIGFTTPYTGNFTTANAKAITGYTANVTSTNTTTANITNSKVGTEVATNFSTANAQVTGGNISGITGLYGTTGVITNFSTGNAVVTGGYADNFPIGANTAAAGTFTTATAQTVNTTTANAINGKTTTLVADNFSTANAVVTGGSVNGTAIGATTASTGNFTTANAALITGYTANVTTLNATSGNITTLGVGGVLTASGNIVAGSGTASTNTTTGALVVVGGAGVSGDINVGGNITAGNVISSTYYSAGGTTRFALTDIGLVVINVAGEEFKFGAAGIESMQGIRGGAYGGNRLSLNNETALISDRGDVVTIKTGTDGSTQNTFTFSNSAMTTPGRITAGGNVVAAATTASTNTTTGALVVIGGAGIGGNLNVGGALTAATASFAALNNTIIGNTTPAAGTFTNLVGNTTVTTNFSTGNARISSGYADNFPIGANTAATGAFTTLTASGDTTFAKLNVTANVYLAPQDTPGTVTINPLNIGTMDNMSIGGTNAANVYASNFKTSTSINADTSGAVFIRAGTASGSAINNIVIGSTEAAAGTFTTFNAETATAATVNATTGNIGMLTVTTGLGTANAQITGGNISGVTRLYGTTGRITNFSTGNVLLQGGTIDTVTIGATSPNTGAFTTLTTTSLQAANIGNTLPGTGTFTALAATESLKLANANVVISGGSTTVYTAAAGTANTTGALVITGTGGAAINGNVYVGQGMVINGNRTTYDTIIRGVNENALVFVVGDSTYDQVAIGGNLTAANITQGAKLVVNSDDSMLVPTGSTAKRPSGQGYTDVNGMLRFNTTTQILEYYGGGQWNNCGTTFTVISSRVFNLDSGNPYGNVDGTNDTFTLPAVSTTAGTIVSINGVLQIAGYAYSVTGDQLVFTEAPAIGDVIDARVLITTATVNGLSSPNGFNQFVSIDESNQIFTGNTSLGAVHTWTFDQGGDFYPEGQSNIGGPSNRVDYLYVQNINMQGGTLVGATVGGGALDGTAVGANIAALGSFTTLYANTSFQVNAAVTTDDLRGKFVAPSGTDAVYSFDKTVYRSGKFFVQLSGGGEYQSAEVMMVQNGTVASIEVYGVTYTGTSSLATFSANIAASTVYLNATSAGANLEIKVTPTLMKV